MRNIDTDSFLPSEVFIENWKQAVHQYFETYSQLVPDTKFHQNSQQL